MVFFHEALAGQTSETPKGLQVFDYRPVVTPKVNAYFDCFMGGVHTSEQRQLCPSLAQASLGASFKSQNTGKKYEILFRAALFEEKFLKNIFGIFDHIPSKQFSADNLDISLQIDWSEWAKISLGKFWGIANPYSKPLLSAFYWPQEQEASQLGASLLLDFDFLYLLGVLGSGEGEWPQQDNHDFYSGLGLGFKLLKDVTLSFRKSLQFNPRERLDNSIASLFLNSKEFAFTGEVFYKQRLVQRNYMEMQRLSESMDLYGLFLSYKILSEYELSTFWSWDKKDEGLTNEKPSSRWTGGIGCYKKWQKSFIFGGEYLYERGKYLKARGQNSYILKLALEI